MKKEILLYLVLFIVGALFFHPDLLTTPDNRFEWMGERSNYYHPFIFAMGLYLTIGVIRLFIKGFKGLWQKLFKN